MSEVSAVLQFVRGQCAGDAPGGVHPGVAPPGAATPFITVQPFGGSDSMGVAGTRVLTRTQWLVEAWGPDSQYADVEASAAALDGHLHGQRHVTVADGQIASSVRTAARTQFPLVAGAQWVRRGGVYSIDVVG